MMLPFFGTNTVPRHDYEMNIHHGGLSFGKQVEGGSTSHSIPRTHSKTMVGFGNFAFLR